MRTRLISIVTKPIEIVVLIIIVVVVFCWKKVRSKKSRPGPKKSYIQKNFGSKKIVQTMLGPKNLRVQKNVNKKNLGKTNLGKQIFYPKFFF